MKELNRRKEDEGREWWPLEFMKQCCWKQILIQAEKRILLKTALGEAPNAVGTVAIRRRW